MFDTPQLVLVLGAGVTFFAILVGISFGRLSQTNNLLAILKPVGLDRVLIRFSMTRIARSILATWPTSAEMYVASSFIVITPKRRGYFSALFVGTLPIVFAPSIDDAPQIRFRRIFIPSEVQRIDARSLSIKNIWTPANGFIVDTVSMS